MASDFKVCYLKKGSKVKKLVRSSPKKKVIPANFTKVKGFVRNKPKRSIVVYIYKKSRKNTNHRDGSEMVSVYDKDGYNYTVSLLTLIALGVAGYVFYNSSGSEIEKDCEDTNISHNNVKVTSKPKNIKSFNLDDGINILANDCEDEYEIEKILLRKISCPPPCPEPVHVSSPSIQQSSGSS
jgi:hypothetical protein